ncbi:carbon-nitrogen hydrolase [Plenodomus tracheiphilus IPT5]|uniref:Carbon-nitrogen hydrolase n=1 Tax=Plenodomus tracheiphilus IPT5 TaxID=1408161 RepID=A0A6A7BC73_9PLEO|nr:carbon-nitrogen hydrolase [Plenodomus tracheiphilus IPT5]
MSTVTIGKSYFEALLRSQIRKCRLQTKRLLSPSNPDRRPQYTSEHDLEFGADLSDNVTISKDEHGYLLHAVREYLLLKSALFRGGLTMETFETLLAGEGGATNDESSPYDYASGKTLATSTNSTASVTKPYDNINSSFTGVDAGMNRRRPPMGHQTVSYDEAESSTESPHRESGPHTRHLPVHDQRTVLITNLPERTTHKDLADIVRGGRLLDIFLRNDRSATISFVEGAAEFLAYAKRTDIYLHTKRLEFRWSDRQFHVPPHVANKISGGATRNLIVRGAANKLTADQIRDHLDHIHNLVVVDITFKNGNAYISTNSVHNALFARTCMMSRTVYKGLRVDYCPDECAESLPRLDTKAQPSVRHVPIKSMPIVNQYALLGTGSDDESDNDSTMYPHSGVRVDSDHWRSVMHYVGGIILCGDVTLNSPNHLIFYMLLAREKINTMAPIVKVAVIQLYPKPMSPSHNFAKAETFIRAAALQGASLAVLPEYHLTGWQPSDPSFASLCDEWEHWLAKYQDLAIECGICIVPGTIVESHRWEEGFEGGEEEGDRLVNVAYFIDQEGVVRGRYVKKNLWGPERNHLTGSGRENHKVFDTPIGKVGLLICWDLAFPEAFRELIAQGAKIIIIPTFWKLDDCNEAGLARNPAAEALFLDSMLTARAFENTCAIVFANAGGPPGQNYAGLSQVTVPFVGPLAKMGGCAEGMSVVDIDMQILEDAESNYKVRSDITSDGWHYDYRHSRNKV